MILSASLSLSLSLSSSRSRWSRFSREWYWYTTATATAYINPICFLSTHSKVLYSNLNLVKKTVKLNDLSVFID